VSRSVEILRFPQLFILLSQIESTLVFEKTGKKKVISPQFWPFLPENRGIFSTLQGAVALFLQALLPGDVGNHNPSGTHQNVSYSMAKTA
jgi:hypothetical protein